MADFNDKFNEFNNTNDITNEFDPQDVNSNKGMAVLAYLSWLVLIPIFAAKESKFARFHCNQGIVLAIAEVVISVLTNILNDIPGIGWIFDVIQGILGIAFLVFCIIGIVNAANGRAKELPVIGGIKIIK